MNQYNIGLRKHWFVACESRRVNKKPYACKILDTPIVLFRSNGKISALLDRCPHRNMALSKGKLVNGCIQCPYHGWEFDTNGFCRNIPGLSRHESIANHQVFKFDVIERHEFIWVKLSQSENGIYHPEVDKDKYDNFSLVVESTSGFINTLENILDPTHTHFVHAGLVRSQKARRQRVTVDIKKTSEKVEIKYSNESKQSGIISKWLEKNRKESFGRFILPSIAELEYVSSRGAELIITFYITPTADNCCVGYVCIFTRKGKMPAAIKKWILMWFLNRALKQDKAILSAQQQNIDKFEEECFSSTEVDFVRPYLLSLLRGGEKTVIKSYQIDL